MREVVLPGRKAEQGTRANPIPFGRCTQLIGAGQVLLCLRTLERCTQIEAGTVWVNKRKLTEHEFFQEFSDEVFVYPGKRGDHR